MRSVNSCLDRCDLSYFDKCTLHCLCRRGGGDKCNSAPAFFFVEDGGIFYVLSLLYTDMIVLTYLLFTLEKMYVNSSSSMWACFSLSDHNDRIRKKILHKIKIKVAKLILKRSEDKTCYVIMFGLDIHYDNF